MVAAPTKEIAIGRKMRLFEIFSPVAERRSAKRATITPNATVTAGTMSNQSRLFVMDSQNSSLEKIAR
jgi:hypothetical protein